MLIYGINKEEDILSITEENDAIDGMENTRHIRKLSKENIEYDARAYYGTIRTRRMLYKKGIFDLILETVISNKASHDDFGTGVFNESRKSKF